MSRCWSAGIAIVMATTACGSPTENTGVVLEPLTWSAEDDPLRFNGAMNMDLAALPIEGAVNRPMASAWFWPASKNSIADRWMPGDLSPAEKYELAFGRTGFTGAVVRELGVGLASSGRTCRSTADCPGGQDCSATGGNEGLCVTGWYGLCHGWSAYAIRERGAKHPVWYKGVLFREADIDALGTLLYGESRNFVMSRRCEAPLISGVTGEGTTECNDSNPGSFHVVLANVLGRWHESVASDISPSLEVWNHPIHDFKVRNAVDGRLMEVSPSEALALIGVDTPFQVIANVPLLRAAEVVLGTMKPAITGKTVVRMAARNIVNLSVRRGATEICRLSLGTTDVPNRDLCRFDTTAGEVLSWQVRGAANLLPAPSDAVVEMQSGNPTTSLYTRNPSATSFYYVQTEVNWLQNSGAPALSAAGESVLPRNYAYVLEVDASGAIVGGEWVGASAQSHPDFLWKPVGVPSSALGGLLRAKDVRLLLELSQRESNGLVNNLALWTIDAANGGTQTSFKLPRPQ